MLPARRHHLHRFPCQEDPSLLPWLFPGARKAAPTYPAPYRQYHPAAPSLSSEHRARRTPRRSRRQRLLLLRTIEPTYLTYITLIIIEHTRNTEFQMLVF